MKNYLMFVCAIAVSLLLGYGGYNILTSHKSFSVPQQFGSPNDFKFAQLQPYFLSGGGAIAGATSVTLKSMKDIDGNTLTMAGVFGTKGFGTLEPGNGTQEEQISFLGLTNNANGTVTLTGVSSVTFVFPYTETSGLAKTHPGSSTFVVSNTSGFYNQLMSPLNNATITAMYIFSSTTPPRYDNVGAQASGTYIATTSEFASIAYVNTISFSGVANATEAVKGIVELATAQESGSSTVTGGTGAGLVLQARYATDTPQNCSTVGCILVSKIGGKIAQAWLDLTQHFNFTSIFSTNASSTNATTTSFAITGAAFHINGINYRWPSTLGASSTVPMTDGSGNITWNNTDWQLLTSTTTSISLSAATTSSFSPRNNLMIVVDSPGLSQVDQVLSMAFNADFAANYGSVQFNDGTKVQSPAQRSINLNNNASTTPQQYVIRLTNSSATTKRGTFESMTQSATNAAFAPRLTTGAFVWSNTSAQVTVVTIKTDDQGGLFTAGLKIYVYGSN